MVRTFVSFLPWCVGHAASASQSIACRKEMTRRIITMYYYCTIKRHWSVKVNTFVVIWRFSWTTVLALLHLNRPGSVQLWYSISCSNLNSGHCTSSLILSASYFISVMILKRLNNGYLTFRRTRIVTACTVHALASHSRLYSQQSSLKETVKKT